MPSSQPAKRPSKKTASKAHFETVGRAAKRGVSGAAKFTAKLARKVKSAHSNVTSSTRNVVDPASVIQTRIVLNAEEWERLQQMLDAPARSHARTKRLMHEPSVFEK